MTKRLYSISLVFALLFLATLHLTPYPFAYLVKTVPILSLAVLAFRNIAATKGVLIGIGLLFSGCGDILLEIDGTGLFVYGLGSFLVAHLFYIAAFIRQPAFKRSQLPILIGIGVYGIAMGGLLFPRLGDMLIPVAAYLCIILAMGIAATVGSTNHKLVFTGAVLFILSDSLIAVNRFLAPVPLSGYLIMTTYYLAQVFITWGATKELPAT